MCTPHVRHCTDAVFRPCKTNHFMNNQRKMDARKKKVSGHKMWSVITNMRKTSGQGFSALSVVMNRLHFFLEQIVDFIPGVQPPG